MRAPDFWDRKTAGLMPSLLRPLGCIVAGLAAWRQKRTIPFKASVPVICIGNLVVGGAGKTPVALDVVARLKAQDIDVHVVMRGYGGSELGPLRVDGETHTAAQVGDEALLLTRAAPTWVSADRKAGVMAATEAGAKAIVLDDGFQNPAVHKDLAVLVVDGEYGFGNGRVMPAGPLRETIVAGLKRTDAVVILGADQADVWGRIQRTGFKKLTVLRASIEAAAQCADLKGLDVYAFAGIGRPQKFFDSLTKLGCKLVGCKAFDDHHPYTDAELETIFSSTVDAQVVTTAKDFVRLSPEHQAKVRTLDIQLAWKNSADIDAILNKVMTNGQ
jgi:tetraacyldisaccharide 4'-kinase